MDLVIKNTWPIDKPVVEPFMHGWFEYTNKEVLNKFIPHAKVIVELGSWYGKSAKYILENTSNDTKLIAIDIWDNYFIKNMWKSRGKDYKQHVPFIDDHPLYDTFLVNMWDYKDRLLPIQSDTIDGLYNIHDLGIVPDLIYIDAGHEYESVIKELNILHELFPNVQLCGDDVSWDGVRKALIEYTTLYHYELVEIGNCWYINKNQ
jgi:hypothetical protein